MARKPKNSVPDPIKFIICSRKKNRPRKSIAACLKCPHNKVCDDFKNFKQPSLFQGL